MNARGRIFLETCTALNLRILNGRIVGDLEDKKTCFHCNGSSVVDYVIGSKSILRNVQNLIVGLKRVKCPSFLISQSKQLNLVLRSFWLMVH